MDHYTDSDLRDYSLLLDNNEDGPQEARTSPTTEEGAHASWLEPVIPPAAQLHLQQTESSTPATDARDTEQKRSSLTGCAELSTESADNSEAKGSTEDGSNLTSIFSGSTGVKELVLPEGCLPDQDKIYYFSCDPSEDESSQGTQRTDEDARDDDSVEEEATAKGDYREFSEEKSSPFAVQKNKSGQVVVTFMNLAPESPAGKDSRDIPKDEEEELMSGSMSVQDHVRKFEQTAKHEQGTIPSAEVPAVAHTADSDHVSVELGNTATVSTSCTSWDQVSKDEEEIANLDREGFSSADGISSQLQPSGDFDRKVPKLVVQESPSDDAPVKKQDAEREEEEEEKMEENFSVVASSDSEDQFSTPNSSPLFNQPATSPPLRSFSQDNKHQHEVEQQGYGQGAQAQRGDWDSPSSPSPTQQGPTLPGQVESLQDVQTSGAVGYPRRMSPWPLFDAEQSRSMQGLESAGIPRSAFRPVADRLQHWGSQQDLYSHGSPQYPSPQQGFYQGPQPRAASPQQNWQGNPQFLNQQAYQQYQMHQQQMWQWQQQQQQQQQWQQHPRHTTSRKDPGHPSGALPRGTSVVNPDSGDITPQTPPTAGHPGFGHGQAQQEAGGSHPKPTSFVQEAVGSDQDALTPCMIRVGGVDMDTDLELLELYFESPKKSDGDKITNLTDHRAQGYVVLTFEDPAVVQRVTQRSHKLSKKDLTVTLYNEDKEEMAEDFSCTVEVTGDSIALDKEMMELYFENTKKSGGGKITKIEVMEEAGMTLITFAEKRAAVEVVKRPHTVSKMRLTVVPYKPPGPPTKIKVSGLTSKASDELLQLYFEKVGDCDVKEVQLDSEKGEAVVTFIDPAAVQTVLKQSHKIGGKPVTVSVLTTSPSSAHAADSKPAMQEVFSVEVKGLGDNTNKDTIQLYFENKRRSGGGPVEELNYDKGSGVAIITFSEAEAVRRVLEKSHSIDGKALKVSLYSKSSSQDAESPRASQELTMVSVRGLSTSTSNDTLLNYFENNRRSGGGDVVEVTLDSKTETFFVTFENPEDAARVSSRKHQLQNQQLEVRPYEPPQMCKDRLVLGNLPEVRTRDELLNYVEVMSDLTVDTILFADEEGTAVVIFDTNIDHQKVKAALMKKPFKGHNLTVDSIPESCTVLVNKLPQDPPVSEDLLTNYFESKRSGGGEVTNVELGSNGEYALVTFADTQVATTVTGRSHTLQGSQLSVSIYMECLGLSGGSEEPTARIPEPFVLSAADHQKLSFLEKLPSLMEALVASLQNSHARLESNDSSGSASIACTLTPEMEGIRQMVKSWAEDVAHVLEEHLQTVFTKQLNVTGEEFTEARDSIKKLIADRPEVGISYEVEQSLLLIVYKGEQLKGLVDIVVTKVKDVQEELCRKKSEKTETIRNSRGKLLLLQKHVVIKQLSTKYPNLVITFHEDDGFLELKGLEGEIQAAKIKIFETFNDITSVTNKWETNLRKELLNIPAAQKIVESLCLEQSPDDILVFTSSGFEVYSFDAERAETIQVKAAKAVQQRVVKFNNDSRQAAEYEEWADLKRSILNRNEGLMLMDEDASSLTIVSVSTSIQSDYKSLQNFLQENSIQQHAFSLPKCLHQLFRTFLQNKVLSLQLTMDDFNFDRNGDQIVVNGNKLCIEAAQGIYAIFRETLTEKRKTYTQPSMMEFFRKPEWTRKQKEIEQELKCLVLDPTELTEDFMGFEDAGASGGGPLVRCHDQLPAEVDFFSTSQSNLAFYEPELRSTSMPQVEEQPRHRGWTGGRSKRGSDAAAKAVDQPRPDLPARPRLYLSIMSDITKEEHHVLVNSSNTTLNMNNGQVSKALLEVGGTEIQQELKNSYPDGINIGDIAISGGGKLMCRKLLHCCLPEEKDEEKIQAVVRDAVMKCMEQAEKLQMGSIGFPSLGTGNLAYPATQVAHTMHEAALDYGRQHPDTVISDVFFILHKKDTNLTQVFRKEHEKYKQMLRDSQKTKAEEESYLAPVNPTSQGIESYQYFEETRGSVTKVLVGLGQAAVETAEVELVDFYNNSVGTLNFDVEHLEQWTDLDKGSARNACKAVFVDITFNFSLSRLQMRGFKDNLGKIPTHQIIKDAEASVNQRQNAMMVLQQVQWSCIEVDEEGEHLLPYDELNNYKIEMAYQDGQERVVVVDSDNKAFIVNFAIMQEISEDSQDTEYVPMTVIRRDKIKSLDIQPPKEWTAMNNQDVDVITLKMNPPSAEYTNIAGFFMQSLGKPNAQIVKIERVQNLTLYKQYQAMKRQMEDTMPNDKHCERLKLWHGTKEEAVDGIIKYGFNRSYSDLKKSAYGQGAYFALSADYSSRNEYAVASQITGERNMFMCKVLVGQYTVGTQNMRIPPKMPGGQHYNSTVDDDKNPQIFVTYSDVQAYPEYRIVFKDS